MSVENLKYVRDHLIHHICANVLGGELNDGRLTSTCEIYDPDTNEWIQGSSLKSPRANHACAVYRDDIYVAGGCYGNQSHDNIW